jgi:hypothetical protein
MENFAAVLTGDLIASTKAGQAAVDSTMDVIAAIAQNEAKILRQDIRLARFRGDGWQIYCSDATCVFRLAVLILANIQSRPTLPKTRISAASGQVSPMISRDVTSASGEAFTISGHNLDSMGRNRLVFQTIQPDHHWQSAFFSYLGWQSARWSPEQAQAIALTFRTDPPHPGKSAEELGISRQAFSARLDGAGYIPVWEADRAFRVKRVDHP